jgi:hypothetical protein
VSQGWHRDRPNPLDREIVVSLQQRGDAAREAQRLGGARARPEPHVVAHDRGSRGRGLQREHEATDVLEHLRRGGNLTSEGTHREQLLGVGDRVDRRDRIGVGLHDDLHELGVGRVAEGDLQHEAVELRLRQRIGAAQLNRVLGREHAEWARQRIRLTRSRHRVLLHRLEQSALGPRGGAIDLVREQQVAEHRPALKLRTQPARGILAEDRRAGDVGGQEVGRELDAAMRQVQGRCEGARHRGLADAGDALEQRVAAGNQAQQHAPHRLALTHYRPGDLRLDREGGLAKGAGVGPLRDALRGARRERAQGARHAVAGVCCRLRGHEARRRPSSA